MPTSGQRVQTILENPQLITAGLSPIVILLSDSKDPHFYIISGGYLVLASGGIGSPSEASMFREAERVYFDLMYTNLSSG